MKRLIQCCDMRRDIQFTLFCMISWRKSNEKYMYIYYYVRFISVKALNKIINVS